MTPIGVPMEWVMIEVGIRCRVIGVVKTKKHKHPVMLQVARHQDARSTSTFVVHQAV